MRRVLNRRNVDRDRDCGKSKEEKGIRQIGIVIATAILAVRFTKQIGCII